MINFDFDFSVWTNVAYIIAAVVIFLLNPTISAAVTCVSLVGLAFGSAWLHSTGTYAVFDLAGIQAVYSSIAVHSFGGPWWVMLIAAALAVGVEIKYETNIEKFMSIYIVLITIGSILSGGIILASIGLVYMLLGLGFFWYHDESLSHGLWHILTAIGTVFLFLAGV